MSTNYLTNSSSPCPVAAPADSDFRPRAPLAPPAATEPRFPELGHGRSIPEERIKGTGFQIMSFIDVFMYEVHCSLYLLGEVGEEMSPHFPSGHWELGHWSGDCMINNEQACPADGQIAQRNKRYEQPSTGELQENNPDSLFTQVMTESLR
ncbi:hypothetical protein EYF80_017952 [Liparis tanakae]|uniref:Uncharacterized protein n=1 Tax=Liparis tanakae TaxID=230148 RepID=A0A4Z2I1Y6_9TELE|nr:hypothetical protein EYF80_017952 [Liparis tanakae]